MKGYIFDMDGVIWDGDEKIPHAVEKINEILASNNKVVFLTNNASKSRESYVKRLGEFGINTDKEHIIVSSYAAGQYISRIKGPSKIFVMGTDDLAEELRQAGHTIVTDGADFVVNGLDKKMNYDKMSSALANLNSGAELISCAPDTTYIDKGVIKIGSGAFAVALEAASGKKATIIGKPSKVIMDIAIGILGVEKKDCYAIGDKLETDILAGNNEGMQTVLVLTGETSLEEARKSKIKPTYIIKGLRELP